MVYPAELYETLKQQLEEAAKIVTVIRPPSLEYTSRSTLIESRFCFARCRRQVGAREQGAACRR